MIPAQLAIVAPNCDAETLAPALSEAAAAYHIGTPLRLSHWLAQLHVETGGFTQFEENLNYSAERLTQVWPKRFPTVASALLCAHNPQKLANVVYANRMGNCLSDDGWRFRGRGPGLTGRENYARIGKLIGIDLENNPDLAATPEVCAKIGGCFWNVKNLNPLADKDDIVNITEAWNGGLIGLSDRKAVLSKYKAAFGITVA